MEKEKTAITEKYTMTVPEAAVYFGIGQKKLRRLCENHTIDSFAKKEMEKFLKFVHDDNCYLLPEFSAHGVHLKEKKKPRKRAQNAALCGV